MKINFMKDEAITYFKANIETNLDNYLQDNCWLSEKYKKYKNENISPFGEFKFDVPDITMDMSAEKSEQTDVNNVKILYLALRNLSDTQASDERLWVGLAHSTFWDYMKYRCKLSAENITQGKILINYFFNYGHKRSLIVHPLARLWWVGRLTYNGQAEYPFGALTYLQSDFATKVRSLFSSNFTNNPKITQAILNSFATIEAQGYKISRNQFLEILRYVNHLGGIIILDYLSLEELKEKIINHYYKVNTLFGLITR